jgi:tetratricopeptide (TPR) repeat protein
VSVYFYREFTKRYHNFLESFHAKRLIKAFSYVLLLLLCALNLEVKAQKIDSIRALLNLHLTDTTRFKALMAIGDHFQEEDTDSAIIFHTRARITAEKFGGAIQIAMALKELALDNLNLSNYETSLALYGQVLGITETLKTNDKYIKSGAKKLSAGAYGGMGTVFYSQGDFSKALQYYFKALKVNEEIANRKGQALNLNNIGIIYLEQNDFTNALTYYEKALRIHEDLDYKRGISAAYGNIGLVYMNQGDSAFRKGDMNYSQANRYRKALEYFNKALKIDTEIRNDVGMGRNYSNIAIITVYQGDSARYHGNLNFAIKNKYPEALAYFHKAYEISLQTGDLRSQAHNLANIGSLYTLIKKYKEAEIYLKKAYALAEEVGSLDDIKQNHEFFKDLYELTNHHSLALKHYRLYIKFRDSISSEENTRNIIQQEYKFNYEKKFAADSVNFAKEKDIREAKIAAHTADIIAKRNQQYALIGGLLMVIVFSGFLYSRFRITRKQQAIIQAQKDVVEEKQKQILDSIQYAKRIQKSLLPTEKYVERILMSRKT